MEGESRILFEKNWQFIFPNLLKNVYQKCKLSNPCRINLSRENETKAYRNQIAETHWKGENCKNRREIEKKKKKKTRNKSVFIRNHASLKVIE